MVPSSMRRDSPSLKIVDRLLDTLKGDMRVLICGGRDFGDVSLLWRTLDMLHKRHEFTWVIDGASDEVTGPYIGADYWANQWARAHGIAWHRVPANWKKFGAAAGPIRNQEMLDKHQPILCVAFPGGRGTADMVRKARLAGIGVVEVLPNSTSGTEAME